MSSLPNLFELNLTTALNNILDLLENRITALDEESEYIKLDNYTFSEYLQAAIRACADRDSRIQMITALQRVNIFYSKYEIILTESTTQRLEKRYLTYLKNKITNAFIQTMGVFDNLAIDLSREVLTKRNVIGNSISADPGILNKFKERMKKNGKPPT